MNLDIFDAKMKHLQWRFKLSSFITGKQTLTIDEVTSHQHCQLGKWIYSEGLEKFGHLSVMIDLEKVHEKIHAVIAHTVELKNAGLEKEAELSYDEMKIVSDEIMILLDDLAKVILTTEQDKSYKGKQV